MKKSIFLVIICTSLGFWVRGQSLSPSVLSTAGAESISPTMSIQWTLGELVVDLVEHENGLLTEGFHQPFLNFINVKEELTLEQENGLRVNRNGYNIKVWPNPVQSILKVQIETDFVDEMHIELLDLMGRKIYSKMNYTPFELIEFDLSQNPNGLYFLKVLKKDGTLIETILNTKH